MFVTSPAQNLSYGLFTRQKQEHDQQKRAAGDGRDDAKPPGDTATGFVKVQIGLHQVGRLDEILSCGSHMCFGGSGGTSK